MRAQGAGKLGSIQLLRCRLGRTHHIGDKTRLAGAILLRHHHRIAHERVLAKPCGDLAGLDPEAADLHLVVVAAQKRQIAVRQIARKVAAAVHPRPRLSAERIGQKPRRGQLGTVQIATRHPRAANVKLPYGPKRNRRAITIQQIDPRVRNRTADMRHNVDEKPSRGRHDRHFSRAVVVY